MAVVKKILIGLVAVVALFAVVVALQPAEFRVVRSTQISAPAETVFAQVNDFHNWQAWSPWAKLDPAAKNSFDGPIAGTGAQFAWEGNDQVGAGRMTIMESRPNDRVRIQLEFGAPFKCTNLVEFYFRPQGDQTSVTWDMSGRNDFISKGFCMFVNMDKMVGGQFEQGLAQMKAIAEAEAQPSDSRAAAATEPHDG